MKPFVKICGITNIADALTAAKAGAHALGFVFHPGSPRFITPRTAAEIIKKLPPHVIPAGVFVDLPINKIQSIIGQTGIRIIQLHGNETPAECDAFSLPVWKALRYENGTIDPHSLDAFPVDAFIFDTFDGKRYGGTGRTGNWAAAKVVASQYKVILAGGIRPENVIRAFETVQPYGIDVSSGVESKPGKKDSEKLNRLFESISHF